MAENPQQKRTPQKKQTAPAVKHQKGAGFWIGLICFSSVWMFILGILVGRGTAPVQFDVAKLEKELIALKELVLQKEKNRMEDYATGTENTTGLDFYEDLKLPEKETPKIPENVVVQQDDEDVSGQKRSLSEKTKKEYAHKSEDEAVVAAVPSPAITETEIPENTTSAEAAEEVPVKSEYRWTIQVASLKDPAAAEKVVTILRQKGYDAYSMAANIAGKGMWYRVRVGPFKERTPAEAALNRLKKDKYNAILFPL